MSKLAGQNAVHRIDLGFVNAWLYGRPRSWLLIDAGMKFSAPRLYRRLGELDIAPADIKLIVATHAHFDHVGAIGRLRKDAPIPIAAHALAAPVLEKAGLVLSDGFTVKAKIAAHFLRYYVNKSLIAYDAVSPELLISGERRLDDYGFDVTLIPTPGHCDDALSALTGGGYVFTGDLIVNRPYSGVWKHMSVFGTSRELIKEQWRRLTALGAVTVCPGHGEMFPITDLRIFIRR